MGKSNNKEYKIIDKKHHSVYRSVQPIFVKESEIQWNRKYRYENETQYEFYSRLAYGIFDNKEDTLKFLDMLLNTKCAPAGRICYAYNTNKKQSTFSNCFVIPIIDDSVDSIMDSVKMSAKIIKSGGGVGYNFSILRPENSCVRTTNTESSGPLSFMKIFDVLTTVIKGGGNRRGANLGGLFCWHPDIENYITIKNDKKTLTQFNISVVITDEFMNCVENNSSYDLVFPDYESDFKLYDKYWGNKELLKFYKKYEDKIDQNFWSQEDRINLINDFIYANKYSCNGNIEKWKQLGGKVKLYKTINAKELFDKIMENTYNHSEPGVLFYDTINRYNTLSGHGEDIVTTNPCGEQPLSSFDSCNLGSLNLTAFVKDPFVKPIFQYDEFKETIKYMVTYLDKILDYNNYPYIQQTISTKIKRQIGLGYSGLNNMLNMMNLSYSDPKSLQLVENIHKILFNTAYLQSSLLSKTYGSYPLFDLELFKKSEIYKKLDNDVKLSIEENGLRNSRLLSIAPTGTITYALFNYSSSGIEPTFNLKTTREVLENDGSKTYYDILDYSYNIYTNIVDKYKNNQRISKKLEKVKFDSMEYLTPEDHVNMMEVGQRWIDTAISKTINVPADLQFDQIKDIYMQAWKKQLKGCTTFRPTKELQGILTSNSKIQNVKYYNEKNDDIKVDILDDKQIVNFFTYNENKDIKPSCKKQLSNESECRRYKVKWQNIWVYIIVSHDINGHPTEVFAQLPYEAGLTGNDLHFKQDIFMERMQYWHAICRLVSLGLRFDVPLFEITKQLKKSSYNITHLAGVISRILSKYPLNLMDNKDSKTTVSILLGDIINNNENSLKCPICKSHMIKFNGCTKCTNCTYSTCD